MLPTAATQRHAQVSPSPTFTLTLTLTGPGKTESSKIVMRYLAMCGEPKGRGSEEKRASSTLHSLAEKVHWLPRV